MSSAPSYIDLCNRITELIQQTCQLRDELAERDAYAVNLQKTLEMLRAWLVGRVGSAPYISAIDAALAKNLSTPLAVSAETPRSRSPGTTGADTLAAGGTNSRDALTATLDALIRWLDARGAASTVCQWGDSPGVTIRALIEEFGVGSHYACEEQKHG